MVLSKKENRVSKVEILVVKFTVQGYKVLTIDHFTFYVGKLLFDSANRQQNSPASSQNSEKRDF